MNGIIKATKKPVQIEAIHWSGSNLVECIRFMGQDVNFGSRIESDKFDDYRELVRREGLRIITLEGTMIAEPGDYIIKGVKGEYYPCKEDIFNLTYDINN